MHAEEKGNQDEEMEQEEATDSSDVMTEVEKYLERPELEEHITLNQAYKQIPKFATGTLTFKQFVQVVKEVCPKKGLAVVRDRKRNGYKIIKDNMKHEVSGKDDTPGTSVRGKKKVCTSKSTISCRQQLDAFFREHYENADDKSTKLGEVYQIYLNISQGKKMSYQQFLVTLLAIPRFKNTKPERCPL